MSSGTPGPLVFTTLNLANDLRDMVNDFSELHGPSFLADMFGKTFMERVQSLIRKAETTDKAQAKDWLLELTPEEHATLIFLFHVGRTFAGDRRLRSGP